MSISDPAEPSIDVVTEALPARVVALFSTVERWSPRRVRRAMEGAARTAHRERRGTARALCESILMHENRMLAIWLVRDAVRTVHWARSDQLSRQEYEQLLEMTEDAALALLARPGLPIADLAALVEPFLPWTDPPSE